MQLARLAPLARVPEDGGRKMDRPNFPSADLPGTTPMMRQRFFYMRKLVV